MMTVTMIRKVLPKSRLWNGLLVLPDYL